MQDYPQVSISLTSYNQKPKLQRAFDSLINQTYKNLEIIIVDDCSTDGVSQTYIRSLSKKYPDKVRYYFQPKNVGIPKNKNTGFKLAKGELITYLDGDDYYYPEKIEKEVSVFIQNPDLDVVYSNFHLVIEPDKIPQRWKTKNDKIHTGKILKHVISRNFPKDILFRYELMKAKVLKKINFYDENLFAFHDWDSRIRYSFFANIGYCEYVGSAYVINPDGISQSEKMVKLIKEKKYVFDKNIQLLSSFLDIDTSKSIKKQMYAGFENSFFRETTFFQTPFIHLKKHLKKAYKSIKKGLK